MTTIGNESRPAYVYDAETDVWVPIGVGPHTHDEYIDKTIITAKGDIIVGTASEAVAKLGVGPEGSVLIADPTSPTGLAWGEAGGSITVSETAPENPGEGNLWFNSTNATTYIYYDGFWIESSPAIAGPTGQTGVIASDSEPSDTGVLWLDTDEESDIPVPAGGTTGQILAKTSADNYDTAWINPPSGNIIINGAFDINQRNFTSTTTTTYGFDRMLLGGATDGTVTMSAQTFSPGEAPVAGVEATNYVRIATTGQTLATAITQFVQRVEGVRTVTPGKNWTISFYARAASGTPKVALEIAQNFGSGGSAQVNTLAGTPTLTTSWQRITQTVFVPSIAGKTIGANNLVNLAFWISAGSNFAARTGSIGIQNNTIDIWGVQLEEGSVATPFKRNANSLQGELAACQRYYYQSEAGTFEASLGIGFGRTSTVADILVNFPVTMRIPPTSVTFANLAILRPGVFIQNVTALGIQLASKSVVNLSVTSTSLGVATPYYLSGRASGSATPQFIAFSAEL